MTPIGTYSLDYRTSLWGWANDSFPPAARSAAEPLQGLRDLTGFAIFTGPGFEADEHDAADFTALAVHPLQGIGFFRCVEEGRLLYLVVHER